ncbi:MAG TPA: histidine phosphatase family protein [Sphingomicrobium sp.]|nr:histidine phosphatase family protein [Sphingomicrobium sp.]
MKHLAILRHAKSSWDDPHLEDFNRPLNDSGWKAARRMGRELEKRDMKFDLVIASPAARVRETIDGLTHRLRLNVEIRFEPRMYAACEEMLLKIVRDIREGAHAPLLVGHNPGLQQLLVALTHKDPDDLRSRVQEKFPTAALATIELPTHRWSEVMPATGKITELILPKELD